MNIGAHIGSAKAIEENDYVKGNTSKSKKGYDINKYET